MFKFIVDMNANRSLCPTVGTLTGIYHTGRWHKSNGGNYDNDGVIQDTIEPHRRIQFTANISHLSEDHSESNAFYFIMFSNDVSGLSKV